LYHYSIKIKTNIDQNEVKKFAQNHRFFEKNFFEFFFIFGLGPTRPMWLDWTHATWSLAQASDPTKPCTRKILRVNGTVRR
jgi:hypothetical protein